MEGNYMEGNAVRFVRCWMVWRWFEVSCGVSLRVFGVFQVESKELKLY